VGQLAFVNEEDLPDSTNSMFSPSQNHPDGNKLFYAVVSTLLQGEKMNRLIIGFDSAWTVTKQGAIVAVLAEGSTTFREIREEGPVLANFPDATCLVDRWVQEYQPDQTLIFLDQPTVVKNATGQRPVEKIVSSIIGQHGGGMQSAFTGRTEMFGPEAPMWPFLAKLDIADRKSVVVETYPALALIGLEIVRNLETEGKARLPKYNPGRRPTFLPDDYKLVIEGVAKALLDHGLEKLSTVCRHLGSGNRGPVKHDQDKLDALICLVVGLHWIAGLPTMQIGDINSGSIIVPETPRLRKMLAERCDELCVPSAGVLVSLTPADLPIPHIEPRNPSALP